MKAVAGSEIAAFYLGTLIFFTWVVVTIFDDLEGTVNGKPVRAHRRIHVESWLNPIGGAL